MAAAKQTAVDAREGGPHNYRRSFLRLPLPKRTGLMARLKPASPHMVAGIAAVYVRIGTTEAVGHLISLCDLA